MTADTDLISELARFGRTLENYAPVTAASLGNPAQARVLDDLGQALGLDAVPNDLRTLFGWHNGQVPNAPPIEGNRVLLSVEAAVEAWRFLNDPQEDHPNPVDRNWLPILYNGAGDYVVFETVTHQLLEYWHDESSTAVAWPNLAAWVVSAVSKIPTGEPDSHDNALQSLKEIPGMFVAVVQADASSIDTSTLRDLRDALQLPLLEMKRLIAQPNAPILSASLAETASRTKVRNLVVLLEKRGCAPRVTLSRGAEKKVEVPAKAFLGALPL